MKRLIVDKAKIHLETESLGAPFPLTTPLGIQVKAEKISNYLFLGYRISKQKNERNPYSMFNLFLYSLCCPVVNTIYIKIA